MDFFKNKYRIRRYYGVYGAHKDAGWYIAEVKRPFLGWSEIYRMCKSEKEAEEYIKEHKAGGCQTYGPVLKEYE